MPSHFSGLADKPESRLSEKTIWMLQQIRRANAAIIGCIEILNEDGVNEGCGIGRPKVFILLEAHQKMGLEYAIEACSRDIARIFNGHLEDIGVGWLDEICPEVTEEAQARAERLNGKNMHSKFKGIDKLTTQPKQI